MRKKARLLRIVCWLGILGIIMVETPPRGTCQEIFIKTDTEQGAGTLRARGQVCYAVTANHVVANPGNVTVVDSTRNAYAAEVIQRFAQDIAVLHVKEAKRILCPRSTWNSSSATINSSIKNSPNGQGKLVRVLENGAISQIEVAIKSYDAQYIIVAPVRADETLSKGWSGSSLYANNALTGLLTTVNGNNQGQVYRLDYIDELVGEFFKEGKEPDPFFDQVQSLDFCKSLRDVLRAAESHNRLNSLKGEFDRSDSDFHVYQSTIPLPGAKGAGELFFYQYEKTRTNSIMILEMLTTTKIVSILCRARCSSASQLIGQ